MKYLVEPQNNGVAELKWCLCDGLNVCSPQKVCGVDCATFKPCLKDCSSFRDCAPSQPGHAQPNKLPINL